ncbi:MAG: hypothetical protein MHM6MM_007306, partial [Cercozoa sp. M6MM]
MSRLSCSALGEPWHIGSPSLDPSYVTSNCVNIQSIRLVMVTHGRPSSNFWKAPEEAAYQASLDFGVSLTYKSLNAFDMEEMSRLIDESVAEAPDALIVTIPDPEKLSDAITRAVNSKIRVYSFNSGISVAASLGVEAHFSGLDFVDGYRACKRLYTEGAANILCVRPESGQNAAVTLRMDGCNSYIQNLGGTVASFVATSIDTESDSLELRNVLNAQHNVSGVFALGSSGDLVVLRTLRLMKASSNTTEAQRAHSILFAGFDISATAIQQAIVGGEMLFSMDQQSYLQAYGVVAQAVLGSITNIENMPGTVFVTGSKIVDARSMRASLERGCASTYRFCDKPLLDYMSRHEFSVIAPSSKTSGCRCTNRSKIDGFVVSDGSIHDPPYNGVAAGARFAGFALNANVKIVTTLAEAFPSDEQVEELANIVSDATLNNSTQDTVIFSTLSSSGQLKAAIQNATSNGVTVVSVFG